MKISIIVVFLTAALLGMFIFIGCGGGGSSSGPTASWTFANDGGAFSGVSSARFGYGTVNSSGNQFTAQRTVLNQDSSTVSLRHSLPKSITSAPGQEFNVYLPVVWRDSDGDGWPDDAETAYMWRDSTYIYALIYGTGEYAYPGWSKWRMWYSGGVAYKQWMYDLDAEISGTIYTDFYSAYSLDNVSDRIPTSEDFIEATEVAPDE